MAALLKQAAVALNTKIKKYKFVDIQNIIQAEFPIDTEVTDTKMSALGLACSLEDTDEVPENSKDGKSKRECNEILL